jgi:hypothetical protein
MRKLMCIIIKGGHEMYVVRDGGPLRQQCLLCQYETTGWRDEV